METEEALLDNPIWNSLNGDQFDYAVGNEIAKRFQSDVDWFASFASLDSPNWIALADYVQVGDLILTPKVVVPNNCGFKVLGEAPLKHYIYREKFPPRQHLNFEVEKLTQTDLSEITRLMHETEMHPIQRRTIEIGQYIGIRINDKLVAMAGERMHIGQYREIGNVCTSPNYAGRGFATYLVSLLIAGILARNEVPVLHVGADNTGAISVYEKLGFVYRKAIDVQVVEYIGLTDADK